MSDQIEDVFGQLGIVCDQFENMCDQLENVCAQIGDVCDQSRKVCDQLKNVCDHSGKVCNQSRKVGTYTNAKVGKPNKSSTCKTLLTYSKPFQTVKVSLAL